MSLLSLSFRWVWQLTYVGHILGAVKNYFKQNVTSYTYLTIAAAAAVAYRGYFLQAIARPESLSAVMPFALWQLISPSLIVLFFLVGSLSTFRIRDRRINRKFVWFLHVFVSLFFVIYTPLGG